MRIFLIFLVFPSLLYGQKDSALSFSGIVEVNGATKAELFSKARQWMNETFKDSKEVIQIADKESGEIAGKGIMQSYYVFKTFGKEKPNPVMYDFSIGIYVKDGKYKYEFTSFKVEKNSYTSYGGYLMTTATKSPQRLAMYSQERSDGLWRSMKENLTITVNKFIEDLKEAMSTGKAKTDF